MKRVNIVSWDGGGLGTDIDVLSRALLRAGCDVTFKGRRQRVPRNRMHSLLLTVRVLMMQKWAKLTDRPQFDANLFLETVFPEYLPMARVNCLLPNPEFFRAENLRYLASLDVMLCKTRDAVDALADLPVECQLLYFTSPDKRLPGFVRTGPVRCLHISGQSAVKGSEAVVEAWSHHPEWPELTVVRRARRYGKERAPSLQELPNVRYLTERVSDAEMRQLQNDCEVHVNPSQAEGYGHVIGEGMSCAAVVVTTDAPPMNELITQERGVLIRVARTEPMSRVRRSYVDVADLEARLTSVFSMSAESRAALGQRARTWYEWQNTRFETALREFVDRLPELAARREPHRA